jgi:hypothetical protein
MKRFIIIFVISALSSSLYGQTDTAKSYKLSDTTFWVGKTYFLPEIEYALDTWNPYECLDSIISFLHNNPKLHVEIGCHTDSRPIPVTLDTLSSRRAKQIKEYFNSKGIKPDRVTACGYADHVPRIIERDTNIIITWDYFYKCRNKTFLFKKNTILDDTYIKTIQDPCYRELAHRLNMRTEMKIIRIE